ncbi:tyrosine-type recombinase/integrase [Sphaerochaeta sp.]|jgi:integrase|uniref:tyrosine-type recombinase/integrase n=1 Tax=Sphaerochaeta sp. TaxID=1972642 RepID=UPI002A362AB5|nr:tyrosine-type recombinase/integrase [Sphaerochaeta sp.]MDX9985325.1 tyrosine-type recombinase/integrase [Sphaerochaeta sp.]
MARPKGKFSLYKRTTQKNKIVYYAKIHSDYPAEPDSIVSTGQSSKASAALWTQKYIDDKANEEIRKEQERLNILFSDYATGFWATDGLYAVARKARLRAVSQGFLDSREAITKNHLIPYWGKYRLRDISPKKIDRWVIDLASQHTAAAGTINQRLQILRVMLEEACRQEYITMNPAQFVKPVGGGAKERGVLSLDEVRALLNPRIWPEYKFYAITLLTLATGLRISEVRGLQVSQVHPDYIQVHTAWEEKYGLKDPKCKSMRELPITPYIYEVLQEVIKTTGATEIVFFGARKSSPLSKSCIEKKLYRAIAMIGINEEDRVKRNIVFHSLRHTTNTILRSAGIADSKVRMITGHRQESMTERYTHFRLENYQEISSVQEMLIAK